MLTSELTHLSDCYHSCALQCDEEKLRSLLCLKEEIQDVNNLGQSCHAIFNYATMNYAYVDTRFTPLTGFKSEKLLIGGSEFFSNHLLDPEMVLPFFKIHRHINDQLLKLSVRERKECQISYDYPIRTADHQKKRLLQQVISWEWDSQGKLMYGLERMTDITHWEKDEEMVLTMTNGLSHTSNVFYPQRKNQTQSQDVFSKTELKLLKLLAEGLSSKEIADRAGISFNTVNTHRRNMIKKAKVKNSSELIQYAFVHKVI